MTDVTLLRLRDVMARTGLSRSAIYEKMGKSEFPKQVSLGARAVAWPDDAVKSWIQSRIDASRSVDQKT
ncbi:MAG: AlpA family transcriptional regulator [Proteobacteria bacterium]|nr:AlpA family transcriptional regulator [Pseudomonadota bacterium]